MNIGPQPDLLSIANTAHELGFVNLSGWTDLNGRWDAVGIAKDVLPPIGIFVAAYILLTLLERKDAK